MLPVRYYLMQLLKFVAPLAELIGFVLSILEDSVLITYRRCLASIFKQPSSFQAAH
jgi:hypothetical protein